MRRGEAATSCSAGSGSRAAVELDPAAAADEELLERLRGTRDRFEGEAFKGEACERYTAALKRAGPRSRRACSARVRAAPRAGLRASGAATRSSRRSGPRSTSRTCSSAPSSCCADRALRERYREQFRHLMVDEFQDTNELQLGLIEQLRGPGHAAVPGRRRVPVDLRLPPRRRRRLPARAPPLRRGRGAERRRAAADRELPGLPRDRRRHQRDRGRACSTASSRSPPRSTRGADRRRPVVELLLTVDDRKGWEAEDTELRAIDDDPSSGSKVAEARRLAARLRELVDAGEDPAEIVVLLRAFTHVATLETGAGRGRPRSLRRRRPRLLVTAAGRGHAVPAGGGREPARRRGAVRRPRLARLRRPPRHALAAPADRHGPGEEAASAPSTSGRWSGTWPSTASRARGTPRRPR